MTIDLTATAATIVETATALPDLEDELIDQAVADLAVATATFVTGALLAIVAELEAISTRLSVLTAATVTAEVEADG